MENNHNIIMEIEIVSFVLKESVKHQKFPFFEPIHNQSPSIDMNTCT